MPLALLAVASALWTQRAASAESQARVATAARQSARALAVELISDMSALRIAARALRRDSDDALSCVRASSVFSDQVPRGVRFVISDARGRVLCGDGAVLALPTKPPADAKSIGTVVDPRHGLILSITTADRAVTARAVFSPRAIDHASAQAIVTGAYSAIVSAGGKSVVVNGGGGPSGLDGVQTVHRALGIGDATYELTMASAVLGYPLLLTMLVPLVMWAAAALTSWLVVDRLLVKPLRTLQLRLDDYRPGQTIEPHHLLAIPAQEIRDLGESFQTISKTVKEHEERLAEGLVRQTRLTREVHHRVKNNLQVISSLINLHARGARTGEASSAYAKIQRRVDALAVVHRNHFADMEETRGLNLRAIISDLAANLRASVADDDAPSIRLDFDTTLVTQDVAIAVAFLITEIVELAITRVPGTDIALRLMAGDRPDRALLEIVSPGLCAASGAELQTADLYARVIGGLARQLRSPIEQDTLRGSYTIEIAAAGRD